MKLAPGRVYRTQEFKRWSSNPTRTAEQLVRSGDLTKLRNGLYYRPKLSKWGAVPPSRDEVLRSTLKGTPYLVTGSGAWNALGLGSTAVFPVPLVYNTKRSGEETIGSFRFAFRRVRFPRRPTPEWFVVDLIQNRREAGLDVETLIRNLSAALRTRRYHAERLMEIAADYGTRETQSIVAQAIRHSASGPVV